MFLGSTRNEIWVENKLQFKAPSQPGNVIKFANFLVQLCDSVAGKNGHQDTKTRS